MATKTTKTAPSLAATFSSNLALRRRAAQLSQEALATKAGISVSYVSMLERGQRQPLLETVEAFARALKVQPLDLLRA
jgi:transcriptional regulator with XRE-family HTH domain